MKRSIYISGGLIGLIIAYGFYLDRLKYLALDQLKSSSEFSGWRRLGFDNLNATSTDFFAYPRDVVFTDIEDLHIQSILALSSFGGIQNVKFDIGKKLVPHNLLQELAQNQLKILDLDGAVINDDGLKALDGCPSIEGLILTGSSLDGFPDLHLPNLRELRIGQTKIKESNMPGVFTLKALEVLDLSGSDITSIDVKKIKSLEKLRHIYIGDTKVSAENAEELSKAMPQVRVYR